jgi:hypothetical protein
MFLKEQIPTELLRVENGVVRLCNDTLTCSYSIGISTDKDFQYKYISKELHDLLVSELSKQEGSR